MPRVFLLALLGDVRKDIFEYIISELGSLERMDKKIRKLMADMKSGQRGKGNGKSCGPAGSELRSSRNPGQRRPSLVIVFLPESSGLQI